MSKKIADIERMDADVSELEAGIKLVHEYERYEALDGGTYLTENADEFFMQLTEKQKQLFERAYEYMHKQKAAALKQSVKQPISAVADNVAPQSERISKLFDDYMLITNAGAKTAATYRSAFETFLEIVGDVPASSLRARDVADYCVKMARVPTNRRKISEYKNKTIAQLLAMPIPEARLPTPITCRGNQRRVGSFLRWLEGNNYVNESLTYNIGKVSVKRSSSGKRRLDNVREIFTNEDLEKMFSVDEYQRNTAFAKNPHRYWLNLLALYTGARVNELCQLTLEDVYQHDGTDIWVIDINDNDNKQIKNESSLRKVPVHAKLIELGFIDFVKSSLKYRKRSERIFPELTPDKYGAYARKQTNFFTQSYRGCKGFLDYAGVVKQKDGMKKVFHSFRHTFITAARYAIDERLAKELVGHAARDVHNRVYAHGGNIQELKAAIDKITFEVMHPKPWFELMSGRKSKQAAQRPATQ